MTDYVYPSAKLRTRFLFARHVFDTPGTKRIEETIIETKKTISHISGMRYTVIHKLDPIVSLALVTRVRGVMWVILVHGPGPTGGTMRAP
jgi:hypothetical protein